MAETPVTLPSLNKSGGVQWIINTRDSEHSDLISNQQNTLRIVSPEQFACFVLSFVAVQVMEVITFRGRREVG